MHREIVSVWPMQQPYDHEIGEVLSQYRALRKEIRDAGLPTQKRYEKALRRLRVKIAYTDFEPHSLKDRKNIWLRICHRFVKDLESKLQSPYVVQAAAELRGSRAQRHVPRREFQLHRRETIRRGRRQIAQDQRELTGRLRRRVYRRALSALVRRTKSTADPATAAAKTERLRIFHEERQQSRRKRQELREVRSRKRMRLFSRQKEWLRYGQEAGQAGDDLWAEMEGNMVGLPPGPGAGAWPRLRQQQREELTGAVEEFVKGVR